MKQRFELYEGRAALLNNKKLAEIEAYTIDAPKKVVTENQIEESKKSHGAKRLS
jgi:hypothetical protein